jgi:hypothetical protein
MSSSQEVKMPWYRPQRPSPALLISVVALFVALGGTSYAAFTTLPSNSVGTMQLKAWAVTGTKIRNGAVTGSKLNLAGFTVPSAQHASSASTATSAGNAAALGGISAAGYTRNDCSSTTGQIKGFAEVDDLTLTSSFADISIGYNCSHEAVQARELGTGVYEVRFPDNPAWLAVGNVIDVGGCSGGPCVGTVSFTRVGPGDWRVRTTTASGADENYMFDMIVP